MGKAKVGRQKQVYYTSLESETSDKKKAKLIDELSRMNCPKNTLE